MTFHVYEIEACELMCRVFAIFNAKSGFVFSSHIIFMLGLMLESLILKSGTACSVFLHFIIFYFVI
jgi:hypothetical protein